MALAGGTVIMPPILSMEIPAAHAEVDVKTAYIPGLDGFAIKMSPGFFDNPKLGLPSLNGLMILFSAKTGLVEALLLDNGYLTDLRTAAAGAVAARHLAPQTDTAGVIGTGVQARLQIEAAHLVRPFTKALVWGRDADKARACAKDLGERLEIEVRAEPDPARLVAESQLVITTTPARSPVLQAKWLHPGLHMTAMGSDTAGKNEIEADAFARLDRYVPDRLSQCEALGELHIALAAGTVTDTSRFAELVDRFRRFDPFPVDGYPRYFNMIDCLVLGSIRLDQSTRTHRRRAEPRPDIGRRHHAMRPDWDRRPGHRDRQLRLSARD